MNTLPELPPFVEDTGAVLCVQLRDRATLTKGQHPGTKDSDVSDQGRANLVRASTIFSDRHR